MATKARVRNPRVVLREDVRDILRWGRHLCHELRSDRLTYTGEARPHLRSDAEMPENSIEQLERIANYLWAMCSKAEDAHQRVQDRIAQLKAAGGAR